MRNRLFNACVLLSLGVCIATAVVCLRSYRRCDVLVRVRGPADRVQLTSEFGLLVLEIEAKQKGDIQPTWVYFESPLPRQWNNGRELFGFRVYRGAVRHYVLLPPTPLLGVAVPHGFVALAAAVLPVLWLDRRRRFYRHTSRARLGLCTRCGYDLRASAGRCPECGNLGVELASPVNLNT